MTEDIDVKSISRVFGDRVLIKRRGNPDKKGGLYVPASVAARKEPKKVWWGEVAAFGEASKASDEHKVVVGDVVGVEPIGHHYASWRGADGCDYCWVPDEHLALVDEGSVADYYADVLDRKSAPRLRVLGARILARELGVDGPVRGVHRARINEDSEAQLGEVIAVGAGEIPVVVGDRVLHVVADAGSSAVVDLFEPRVLMLRVEDLIATYEKVQDAVLAEVSHG